MKTTIPNKNFNLNYLLYLISFLILFSCDNLPECESEIFVIDTNDVTLDHPDFSDVIESYNATYNGQSNTINNDIQTNIYVDLSDGITKYAIADRNNRELLQQFFFSVESENDLNYFELSNDSIIQYDGSQALSYFMGAGHRDSSGNLKQGAPIDDAINVIAGKNDLGIIITDGELYDSAAGQVSENPWASDAIKNWFSKNGSLDIIHTNFQEKNGGETFNKHMYLMIFIPENYEGSFVNSFKKDMDSSGVIYKSNNYSTSVSGLYSRDSYPDSQTPGTLQLNTYGEVQGYFSENNFEYIDMTNVAEFTTDNSGIVYYLRDVGDVNGNPFNYPLVEKLFIDLESISNYSVNNVTIAVSNVTEDFSLFKRNYYAKINKPKISIGDDGKDELDENNYLIFDECFNADIDGNQPYDTFEKILEDTKDNFSKMLDPDYRFDSPKIDNKLNDFIFIDNEAGMNNLRNGQKFETVLKFDQKFNEDTKGLYEEKNNIIKVDVIVDKKDFELKPINRSSLTWDKIDRSGIDQTLYISLRNVLNNNKPNSILYTYYIEFGPFNN